MSQILVASSCAHAAPSPVASAAASQNESRCGVCVIVRQKPRPECRPRPALASESEHRHDGGGLIEPGAARARRTTCDYRDILLATDAVGHRRGGDGCAQAEVPQLLEGIGIVGDEMAIGPSVEQQVAV